MKRILVALVALSLAPLALADDVTAVYGKRCATCHGKDGRGTSVGLKMGAQDLRATTLSEEEVALVIANGRGKMTAYKDKLGADEIKALATYVKTGLK